MSSSTLLSHTAAALRAVGVVRVSAVCCGEHFASPCLTVAARDVVLCSHAVGPPLLSDAGRCQTLFRSHDRVGRTVGSRQGRLLTSDPGVSSSRNEATSRAHGGRFFRIQTHCSCFVRSCTCISLRQAMPSFPARRSGTHRLDHHDGSLR